MPTLPPLPGDYYIRINNERCHGNVDFVLARSAPAILLEQKDPSNPAQLWKVIPAFDKNMGWSGAVFQNVEVPEALYNVGVDKELTTKPWVDTANDDAYAWQIRLSTDNNHAGESLITSAHDGSVIDQGDQRDCLGSRVITYHWKGNNNQYWVVEKKPS